MGVDTTLTNLEGVAVIEKLIEFDMPPPGAGFETVMGGVPTDVISVAGICAWSWFAFTNVVVRFAPFHLTVELDMKLLPLTVKTNPAPPAVALVGLSDVIAGSGLLAVIVNTSGAVVPPPGAGLVTVTFGVPTF